MKKIIALQLALILTMIVAKAQEVDYWYYNVNEEGVFLDGYDVVAYHSDKKAAKGAPAITSTYRGVTYRFVSRQNRKMFDKSPEKYLPAFGGWCTFLMGIDKNRFPPTRAMVDPQNFKMIDGRLHLFGKNARQDFKTVFENADQDTILKRAEMFWKTRESLARKSKGLPEGMNPHARMEMLDWMPFMGDWTCDLTWWADSTGQNKVKSTGKWFFRFGYYGYCIQDDFVADQLNPVAGTTNGPAIRGYDPRNEEWHMTYIPINQSRDRTWLMRGRFIAEGIIEGTMEITDASGNPVLQKVRLESRSKDEFIWSADWSYDGGNTWLKNADYNGLRSRSRRPSSEAAKSRFCNQS